MSEIQILDQGTIDKIAAGEVVERPSSIAKELVENALDAGADRITVEIREGGIRLLRVTDNGKGIPEEEVRLAFLRHATSKLRSVGDFGTLRTLGFRGEALSSIAAVSRVEMITRRTGEMTGTRYCIEGGRERLLEEVGAPEGTTILVRDIFYNTPARGKFLKTAQTEAAHVGTFVEMLALAKPGVAFEFISNGDSKLVTAGTGNLKDVIYHIYGKEAASELIPIDAGGPDLHIGGVIARPAICRGNRNFENYFVNGRYVRSRVVAAAIEEGYGTMLMKHMYPFTCLFIDLKGTNVDVNVHPTKMEVRFSNEKGVFNAVKSAVENALRGQEMVVHSVLEKEKEAPKKEPRYANPAPFETRAIRERELSFGNDRQMPPQRAGGFPGQAKAPVGSGQAAAKMEAPAGGGDFKGQTKAPAGSGQAAAKMEAPAGSGDFTGQTKAPAGSGQAAAKMEAPMGSGQAAAKMEAPAGGPAAANKGAGTSSPASESAGTVIPANQGSPAELPLRKDAGAPAFGNAGAFHEASSGAEAPVRAGEPPEGIQQAGEQLPPEKPFDEKKDAVYEQQELIPGMLSPKARSRRRILGCAFKTYWIIEYGKELFLIDQHAAHEKVLYERFTKMYQNSAVTQQLVSPPLIFTATLEEKALLDEYMEAFAAAGFEIEPFGGREYKVSAVPYHLSMLGSRTLFTEMLDHLETSRDPKKLSLYILRIATEACKAAVKGGDVLSLPEAEALIDELFECEDPYHCPHGRPTVISFTEKDLEKRFKRII